MTWWMIVLGIVLLVVVALVILRLVNPAPQHVTGDDAVVLTFKLKNEGMATVGELSDFCGLEKRIERAVVRAQVASWDGHGSGEGVFDIFFYGPDGERLWSVIEPVLAAEKHPRGHATIRRGAVNDPQAKVRTVEL